MSHVEITSRGLLGRILVGGVDLSNAVRAITVYMFAGEFTEIRLTVAVADITQMHDEQASVYIQPESRQLLIDAGWTPPETDLPYKPNPAETVTP